MRIGPKALMLMRAAVAVAAGDEVGGIIITAEDDPFYIVDILFPKQTVSPASVSHDEADFAAIYESLIDLDTRNYRHIFWHHHPFQSATPSPKDEETFREAYGDCPWAIMLISSTAGYSCRLRVTASDGLTLTQDLPVVECWAHLDGPLDIMPNFDAFMESRLIRRTQGSYFQTPLRDDEGRFAPWKGVPSSDAEVPAWVAEQKALRELDKLATPTPSATAPVVLEPTWAQKPLLLIPPASAEVWGKPHLDLLHSLARHLSWHWVNKTPLSNATLKELGEVWDLALSQSERNRIYNLIKQITPGATFPNNWLPVSRDKLLRRTRGKKGTPHV